VIVPPLRSVAPFPVGAAVQALDLQAPDFAALVATQVSQLTPEWEMKMEYILQPDRSLKFERPDMIAAFARAHGLRLFGHTLVWYAEKPDAWNDLEGADFRQAYADYIAAVVGRYRGQAEGWDVVNEAVTEEGEGWRDSIFSERLGLLEHMRLAYQLAHEADPAVPLYLNDYYLESKPKKRATFMGLAEALLKAGAPLSGLGCQTHLAADLPSGAITAALKDLATLGLPIRISEMDVSIVRGRGMISSDADLVAHQTELYREAAHAFIGLPARQRADFTFWGLEDSKSWLRRENGDDTPLLFDDAGRAKPAAAAWEAGLRQS
jgi:endo-1,4-beta-xylanase